MKFREMTKEQICEESFIDLGHAILEEKHESLTLQELLDEIKKLNKFTEAQMKERKLQYYTDMNIDGRFLAISENRWGLREWYPVEQIEEETAPTVKVRKKKSKSKGEDDIEDDTDDDEIAFEEDFDEFVEDVEDFDLDDDDDDDDDEDDDVVEIEEVVAEELLTTTDEFEIVVDEEDEEEDEDEDEDEK
ncbi:DNA-directed RNA polymerase subunit delta [Paenisporosarcina macmurdoensis]|uniref:Probable DNA-directed RNA polymerase subunit delta n=1 Tax=Paenisporosarcina macmurdoensis TaxID=212659 RepID=A0ABW1LDF4_9BACL|nr:DNA-directed RNA polymerase subunit delta [Paenisporosarcina sp.]